MTRVAVVGGGAAGLSAALVTAKNGLDTVVFDTDETWLHKAHLFNYLGIESQDGSAFVEDAREQVDSFGVDRRREEVTDVESGGDGFTDEDVVDVDVSMETSVDDAYATGAMVRAEEWQAVISAGDGAAAALNVLSKEKGEHFHDFDTPADAE
jgi:thioredoxin reductase